MLERMCVSCGKRAEKAELVRIASSLSPDFSMNSQGRGAYVCRSNACITKLATSKTRLFLSLRTQPSKEALQRLSSQLLSKVINGQD